MKLGSAIVRLKLLINNPTLDSGLAREVLNRGWEEVCIRTNALYGCTHTPIRAGVYEYELDPQTSSSLLKLTKVSVSGVGELEICHPDELISDYTSSKSVKGMPIQCALLNKDGRKVIIVSPTPTVNIPADISGDYDTKTDGLWLWYKKKQPYLVQEDEETELTDEYAGIGLYYSAWMLTQNANFMVVFENSIRSRNAYLSENRIIKRDRII